MAVPFGFGSWVDEGNEDAAVQAAAVAAAERMRRAARPRPDPMFGVPVRGNLHPGEDAFFKSSPTVTGMAAEDNSVILNPHADPSVNRDAVAKNEAFRVQMRKSGATPNFPVTPEQTAAFAGTPYAGDPLALRSTIAARVYSGDPSANPTPEQKAWVSQFVRQQPRRKEGLATKVPEVIGHIPMGMVGAAAGMVDAAREIAGEQTGTAPMLSTDYDPRRVGGALSGETALNVMGLPGILSASPATLASGAIKRTRDLPMDEASRMQRARKLGFNVDEPLFHGSGKGFDAFDLSKSGAVAGSGEQKAVFVSPSPQVASHYSELASIRDPLPGETPHGSFAPPHGGGAPYIYDGGQVYPVVARAGKQKTVRVPYYNTDAVNRAIADATKGGYDTVRFKNMADSGMPFGERQDQIAVLKPENIRSRFAAFDPANKDSGFLLGANAADPRLSPIFGSLAPWEER